MSDLTGLTVAEASRHFASGEISSADLTEAYLARIAAVDPALNCYVLTRVEEARAEARDADARRARGDRRGALDGIPVALKDNIDVAGVPTTNGMGAQGSATAASDAEVTRRLRAAGAAILGKLNMHEGALGGTTDNFHHGRTQNPWQLGFTPGGSSGGTGAAVAARLCAAGIGTDCSRPRTPSKLGVLLLRSRRVAGNVHLHVRRHGVLGGILHSSSLAE